MVSKILTVRWAAPVAAIAFGVLTLGLDLAVVPLDILTHQAGGPVADGLSTAVVVVLAVAVGTLLAARRPRNPIGWLILAILIVGFSPTSQYLILDYGLHHGTLPLGGFAVALQECWPMLLFFVAVLLWIFPDGMLPPGRWRRPSAILLVTALLMCLAASARGALVAAGGDVRLQADGDLANPLPRALAVLAVVVILATVVSWVTWLAIQIPTYRHASGERRQQLKWLYSGAAIFVVALLIGIFIVPLAMRQAPGWGTQPVVNVLVNLAAVALPVCIGVAVLKYRLYAIDRIISRVITYAIITAVLAGVFAGLVLLATNVLPVKTPVAVAASTLAAAALFNPLRRRVQRAVDRRFNRARYNAESVVAAFTARLRQTVDLDTVQDDLVATIGQAFQPAHISVWLPPGIGVEPLRHGN